MKVLVDTNVILDVQYVVGESLAVDYIVTRNTQDFTTDIQSDGSITAITPFIAVFMHPIILPIFIQLCNLYKKTVR